MQRREQRPDREQRRRVRTARGRRLDKQKSRRTADTAVLVERTESPGETQTEALRVRLKVWQTQKSPDCVHVRAAGGFGEQIQVDAIPVRVRTPQPGAVLELDGDSGENMVSEPPDQVEETEPGRGHERADQRRRERTEQWARRPESPEPVSSYERPSVHAHQLSGSHARWTRLHHAVTLSAGSRGTVTLHAGLTDLRGAHILRAALIRTKLRGGGEMSGQTP